MSKYEFIKNGMDDYTLKYKDKEIKFNSKLDYIVDLQEAPKKARLKMVSDLSKQGLSVKDLIKEEKKDGKTLLDNSSKEYIEEAYINEAQQEAFSNIVNKMLGMTLEDIILDMGLDESEIASFGEEIGKILIGNYTPSGEQKK